MQRLDHKLDEALITILNNIKSDALGDRRFLNRICGFLSENNLCRDVKACELCPVGGGWQIGNTLKEMGDIEEDK